MGVNGGDSEERKEFFTLSELATIKLRQETLMEKDKQTDKQTDRQTDRQTITSDGIRPRVRFSSGLN